MRRIRRSPRAVAAPLLRVAVASLLAVRSPRARRARRRPVEDRTSRRRAAGRAAPAPAPARRRRRRAEPDWRPQTYTVKRGDTLYQIALDHGLDYRELAAWNNLENVNLIRVGQVLRLAAPGGAGARLARRA